MAWPLSQDYNEAIQNPLPNFADPDLKRGEVVTNALGIPLPCSGNFADVYQLRCPDGGRWAVKCFTRKIPGLRERYQEITRHLHQAKLPFTVDFTYLEQGIRIRRHWFPVLKMRWVEGLTLNTFIRQSLDKPLVLEALLQIWVKMGNFLREAEVGHCDLQHGNVLLVPGSTAHSLALKLIDYDGMWVPALAGKKSGEVGHPAYQHPQRLREGIYSLDVDRFSLLLVGTVLQCLLTGDKALWEKHDNGDNMLFRETDFQSPTRSVLFSHLVRETDPMARELVGHLLKSLRSGLESAPLLDQVVPVKPPAPAPLSPQTEPAASQHRQWLDDHRTSAPSSPTYKIHNSAPTTPWLDDHRTSTPLSQQMKSAPAWLIDDASPCSGLDGEEKGPRQSRRQKPRTSRRWMFGTAAVVVLVAVGGVAFWAMNGGSSNTRQSDHQQVNVDPHQEEGTLPPVENEKRDKHPVKDEKKKEKPREASAAVPAAPKRDKEEKAEIRELRQAAEKGDPVAMNNLGVLSENGQGVEKDAKEAAKWYRKAADNGNAAAMNNLGVLYAAGRGVPKDEMAAIKWHRKAAEKNFAPAQDHLGLLYEKGAGVEKDEKEAEKWYRKAAEQGHGMARKHLAALRAFSQAREKAEPAEVRRIRKAAEEGQATEQARLGWMYATGLDVKKDDKAAVQWYRKAAEQGHIVAQNNLGVMYTNGQGVAKDDKEAVRWIRKAAEQGYAQAQYTLGLMSANGRGVDKDEKAAAHWYRKAAEQNLPEAQYQLGSMYLDGRGVAEDKKEAAEWLRKAVAQGYALARKRLESLPPDRNEAKADIREIGRLRKAAEEGRAAEQSRLGWLYATGQGVKKDEKEAVKWYRKAAEQGHAGAQNNLGLMYANGQGAEKDDKEAFKWFRKAAEQNNPTAQANLAVRYMSGQGIEKDEKEAVRWFRKAAEQNFAEAQYLLGLMFADGRGTKKDGKEAASWYRKAADQGHMKAQHSLGMSYLYGRGVEKNEKEGVLWVRKAAEQGHVEALCDLGDMHAKGKGVAKDDEQAVRLYRKSAEQNWAKGQYALGSVYEVGRGVSRDLDEARKWYQKAAGLGLQEARDRLAALEKVKPLAKAPAKPLSEVSLFQMFRSKGGPIVVLAFSGDGIVKLHNERGEIGPLKGHTATVTCAAFTPDGTRGVTGGKDRTVRVWDLEKRQSIRRLKGHTKAVVAVAISANGKSVLSTDGSVVLVWDAKTGKEVGRLPHDLPVTCIGFLPGGTQAVCAVDTTGKGLFALVLHVWDLPAGRLTKALPGGGVQFSAFAFTPDGLLVGGNKNGDIIKVALTDRNTTINARSGVPKLQRVSFSADGRLVLFEGSAEVGVFSLADKMMVTTLVQKEASRGAYAASLDKDGANLTYADRNPDGTVEFKTKSNR